MDLVEFYENLLETIKLRFSHQLNKNHVEVSQEQNKPLENLLSALKTWESDDFKWVDPAYIKNKPTKEYQDQIISEITKTLSAFRDYIASTSIFTKEEKATNNGAYQQFMTVLASIEGESLIPLQDGDTNPDRKGILIRDLKFNHRYWNERFSHIALMKKLTGYIKKIINISTNDSILESKRDDIKTGLGLVFRYTDISCYRMCPGGHSGNIREADSRLGLSFEDMMYDYWNRHVNAMISKQLPKVESLVSATDLGNRVHIPFAIAYILGVPKEIVESYDKSMTVGLSSVRIQHLEYLTEEIFKFHQYLIPELEKRVNQIKDHINESLSGFDEKYNKNTLECSTEQTEILQKLWNRDLKPLDVNNQFEDFLYELFEKDSDNEINYTKYAKAEDIKKKANDVLDTLLRNATGITLTTPEKTKRIVKRNSPLHIRFKNIPKEFDFMIGLMLSLSKKLSSTAQDFRKIANSIPAEMRTSLYAYSIYYERNEEARRRIVDALPEEKRDEIKDLLLTYHKISDDFPYYPELGIDGFYRNNRTFNRTSIANELVRQDRNNQSLRKKIAEINDQNILLQTLVDVSWILLKRGQPRSRDLVFRWLLDNIPDNQIVNKKTLIEGIFLKAAQQSDKVMMDALYFSYDANDMLPLLRKMIFSCVHKGYFSTLKVILNNFKGLLPFEKFGDLLYGEVFMELVANNESDKIESFIAVCPKDQIFWMFSSALKLSNTYRNKFLTKEILKHLPNDISITAILGQVVAKIINTTHNISTIDELKTFCKDNLFYNNYDFEEVFGEALYRAIHLDKSNDENVDTFMFIHIRAFIDNFVDNKIKDRVLEIAIERIYTLKNYDYINDLQILCQEKRFDFRKAGENVFDELIKKLDNPVLNEFINRFPEGSSIMFKKFREYVRKNDLQNIKQVQNIFKTFSVEELETKFRDFISNKEIKSAKCIIEVLSIQDQQKVLTKFLNDKGIDDNSLKLINELYPADPKVSILASILTDELCLSNEKNAKKVIESFDIKILPEVLANALNIIIFKNTSNNISDYSKSFIKRFLEMYPIHTRTDGLCEKTLKSALINDYEPAFLYLLNHKEFFKLTRDHLKGIFLELFNEDQINAISNFLKTKDIEFKVSLLESIFIDSSKNPLFLDVLKLKDLFIADNHNLLGNIIINFAKSYREDIINMLSISCDHVLNLKMFTDALFISVQKDDNYAIEKLVNLCPDELKERMCIHVFKKITTSATERTNNRLNIFKEHNILEKFTRKFILDLVNNGDIKEALNILNQFDPNYRNDLMGYVLSEFVVKRNLDKTDNFISKCPIEYKKEMFTSAIENVISKCEQERDIVLLTLVKKIPEELKKDVLKKVLINFAKNKNIDAILDTLSICTDEIKEHIFSSVLNAYEGDNLELLQGFLSACPSDQLQSLIERSKNHEQYYRILTKAIEKNDVTIATKLVSHVPMDKNKLVEVFLEASKNNLTDRMIIDSLIKKSKNTGVSNQRNLKNNTKESDQRNMLGNALLHAVLNWDTDDNKIKNVFNNCPEDLKAAMIL